MTAETNFLLKFFPEFEYGNRNIVLNLTNMKTGYFNGLGTKTTEI